MKNDFDIFTVSETWLDNTVQDLEVEITTYNIYRLDRLNKSGGGVCAFVKNCYKVECLNEFRIMVFTNFGLKSRQEIVNPFLFSPPTDRLMYP